MSMQSPPYNSALAPDFGVSEQFRFFTLNKQYALFMLWTSQLLPSSHIAIYA